MKQTIFIVTLVFSSLAFASGDCDFLSKKAIKEIARVKKSELSVAVASSYQGLFYDADLHLRIERHRVKAETSIASYVYEVDHDDLTCEITKVKLLERY